MKTIRALLFVVAPALVNAGDYSNMVLAEATLLHYWPMNDAAGCTTIAAAAGGIDMDVTGATCGVAGQNGTAVLFDGNNDSAQTQGLGFDLSAHSRLSVEFLLNITSHAAADKVTYEFGAGAIANGDFLFTQDNAGGYAGSFLAIHAGDVGANGVQVDACDAGEWHHIVVGYDFSRGATAEVDVYMDGALLAQQGYPLASNNTGASVYGNSNTLYIMSRSGSSLFAPGTLQHFAIYSELPAARIAAHATQAFSPDTANRAYLGTRIDSQMSTTFKGRIR